jgi:hypothetical protein
MFVSLRALLNQIVDYAGLFPPARLSLDESIRNYARYQREPEGWMLARFICPAARLAELDPYVGELFKSEPPLRISALGRGGETSDEFLENLKLDLDAASEFRSRNGEHAAVGCFETRLPGDIDNVEGRADVQTVLAKAGELFEAAGFAALPRFYEVPVRGDCQQTVNAVATSLAMLNRGLPTDSSPMDSAGSYAIAASADEPQIATGRTAGIKLRCGGLEPAAIPSVQQVATVIAQCCSAGVPLKFTAGLHHPTRQLDAGLGTHPHGFLNVFVAGVLACALGLEYHDILALVEEEDVRQFRFSDDFIAWCDAEATVSEVEYARRHRVISFGSCSFNEPREELRELGLL